MSEPEAYTLDTSAIIAYFADEPGADWLELSPKSSRTKAPRR